MITAVQMSQIKLPMVKNLALQREEEELHPVI